jgi:hypothetical protein
MATLARRFRVLSLAAARALRFQGDEIERRRCAALLTKWTLLRPIGAPLNPLQSNPNVEVIAPLLELSYGLRGGLGIGSVFHLLFQNADHCVESRERVRHRNVVPADGPAVFKADESFSSDHREACEE